MRGEGCCGVIMVGGGSVCMMSDVMGPRHVAAMIPPEAIAYELTICFNL